MTGRRWKSPESRQRSLAALAANRYIGRGKRWFGKQTHGKHCHPLVNTLVDCINKEQTSFEALGQRVGLRGATIRKWRTERNPKITDLEAAFNALGFELKVVRRRERIAA